MKYLSLTGLTKFTTATKNWVNARIAQTLGDIQTALQTILTNAQNINQ